MAFDFEMIQKVYDALPARVEKARKVVGRPLTLTEKILYAHLYETQEAENFQRGKSYVDFAPDPVAMQDATAQMALLQFMQAGKAKVAVPSTVHCDHLILAKDGAAVGIGMGQVNRVDSARLAISRAGDRARGSFAASDAFFPFADGVEILLDAGVRAIVQPGGSVRDEEVIAAVEKAGVAMYFTGVRHFAHT